MTTDAWGIIGAIASVVSAIVAIYSAVVAIRAKNETIRIKNQVNQTFTAIQGSGAQYSTSVSGPGPVFIVQAPVTLSSSTTSGINLPLPPGAQQPPKPP